MNEQEPIDAIDLLLREQDAYIDDHGFTRRVLAALPRRRRLSPRPILLGAIVVGCALAAWWFPTSEIIAVARLDFSSITTASLSALAAALAAIGSLVWGALALVNSEC
ncbi:MAG: hypothetical protein AAB466_08125 [Verrucomicrobiota bacterium]